eukprot:g4452.t1
MSSRRLQSRRRSSYLQNSDGRRTYERHLQQIDVNFRTTPEQFQDQSTIGSYLQSATGNLRQESASDSMLPYLQRQMESAEKAVDNIVSTHKDQLLQGLSELQSAAAAFRETKSRVVNCRKQIGAARALLRQKRPEVAVILRQKLKLQYVCSWLESIDKLQKLKKEFPRMIESGQFMEAARALREAQSIFHDTDIASFGTSVALLQKFVNEQRVSLLEILEEKLDKLIYKLPEISLLSLNGQVSCELRIRKRLEVLLEACVELMGSDALRRISHSLGERIPAALEKMLCKISQSPLLRRPCRSIKSFSTSAAKRAALKIPPKNASFMALVHSSFVQVAVVATRHWFILRHLSPPSLIDANVSDAKCEAFEFSGKTVQALQSVLSSLFSASSGSAPAALESYSLETFWKKAQELLAVMLARYCSDLAFDGTMRKLSTIWKPAVPSFSFNETGVNERKRIAYDLLSVPRVCKPSVHFALDAHGMTFTFCNAMMLWISACGEACGMAGCTLLAYVRQSVDTAVENMEISVSEAIQSERRDRLGGAIGINAMHSEENFLCDRRVRSVWEDKLQDGKILGSARSLRRTYETISDRFGMEEEEGDGNGISKLLKGCIKRVVADYMHRSDAEVNDLVQHFAPGFIAGGYRVQIATTGREIDFLDAVQLLYFDEYKGCMPSDETQLCEELERIGSNVVEEMREYAEESVLARGGDRLAGIGAIEYTLSCNERSIAPEPDAARMPVFVNGRQAAISEPLFDFCNYIDPILLPEARTFLVAGLDHWICQCLMECAAVKLQSNDGALTDVLEIIRITGRAWSLTQETSSTAFLRAERLLQLTQLPLQRILEVRSAAEGEEIQFAREDFEIVFSMQQQDKEPSSQKNLLHQQHHVAEDEL